MNSCLDVGATTIIGPMTGFSALGLMGRIIFGCIGFVSFVFGKRNSEWFPIIIRFILMGYAYFARNTIILYLVGILLIVALFICRNN